MSTTPPTFAEAEFRKASKSNPNRECVRVARRDGWVELRDDKTEFGSAEDHRLVFTAAEFDAVQERYRATGDVSGTRLEIVPRGGLFVFRSAAPGPDGDRVELVFDRDEVDAFFDGVLKHEFDAAAFAVA